MARWAPLKHDTLAALAEEILHNYPRGFARLAVAGDDPSVAAAFADDLGGALREAGRDVTVQDRDDGVPERGSDSMFVVSGAVTADPALTGYWNYRVWLDTNRADRRDTRLAASAIVDVTDPEHPRRVFADSC